MFNKIISLILSFVMSISGFIYSSFNDVIDAVSELFFGIPYTADAIKSDFFAEIDDNDVTAIDSERGFVNNKIAVFIDADMSFSDRFSFFAGCGGILVGWCAPADLYILSYPIMTYNQAEKICDKLEHMSGVELSIPVLTHKNEKNITPTDDFGASADNPNIWNEIVPDGNNWWLEAIDARQAWDYADYFSKISIGVLDAGFETSHNELSGKIVFPNNRHASKNIPDSHGTHVAGIIGAKHNNGGISGICENSKLICVDWQPDLFQFWNTDISIFFGISALVKAGAKVINLSLGTSASKTSNNTNGFIKLIESAALSYMMASLLSKGYDFIAVQSAGNGDYLGDPIDSTNNGHFCQLDESNIFVGSKNISAEDILDRIFIVASATNNADGTFTQSSFTNVGKNVTIAAPGEDIYSSTLKNAYEYMSGTSMSAPVVTGVVSLVWSINPQLSGADVKDIVCNSTDSIAKIYTENEYYYDVDLMEYPMVNAKLAVEEAIRRKDSTVGTVSGKLEGAETVIFNGKSHTVFADGTYSFVEKEGSGIAEFFDINGNLINSVDLTVIAGQMNVIENVIIPETPSE